MAALSFAPSVGFSYGGERLTMVDDQSIMHVCGNGLKVKSTTLDCSDRFIFGAGVRASISAFDHNHASKRFALCPISDEPEIQVFNANNDSFLFALKQAAEVTVVDVAFTRDGKHLVSISGLPDFRLCVWNLETRALVAGASTVLPFPCATVVPHPFDPLRAVTAGEEGILFWQGATQFGVQKWTSTPGGRIGIGGGGDNDGAGGGDNYNASGAVSDDGSEHQGRHDGGSLGLSEEEEAELGRIKNEFVSHFWTVDDSVVALNRAGDLVTFHAPSGTPVRTFQVPATPATAANVLLGGADDANAVTDTVGATAIMLTKHHVVCACADGAVRWATLGDTGPIDDTTAIEHTVMLSGLEVEGVAASLARLAAAGVGGGDGGAGDGGGGGESKSASAGGAGEGAGGEAGGDGGGLAIQGITMAPSPFYNVFAVGTETGGIYILPIEVPAEDDEEDEDRIAPSRIVDLPGNTGNIHGMAPVAGVRGVMAMVGDDRILQLFGAGRGPAKLLCKHRVGLPGLDQPVVSCAGSLLAPLIAVGTCEGVLRVLLIGRDGGGGKMSGDHATVTALHRSKLHDGAVNFLAFHPSLPLLVTGSAVDGHIFFLDVRPQGGGEGGAGGFPVVGHTRVPAGLAGLVSIRWRDPLATAEVVAALEDGTLLHVFAPDVTKMGFPASWLGESSAATNAATAAAAAAASSTAEGKEGAVAAPFSGPLEGYVEVKAVAKLDAPAAELCQFPTSATGKDGKTWTVVACPTEKAVKVYKTPNVDAAASGGGGGGGQDMLLPAKLHEGHQRGVLNMDYIGDGRGKSALLATAGIDGAVGLWQVSVSPAACSLKLTGLGAPHGRAVTSTAFSADGAWLFSASEEGTIFAFGLEDMPSARHVLDAAKLIDGAAAKKAPEYATLAERVAASGAAAEPAALGELADERSHIVLLEAAREAEQAAWRDQVKEERRERVRTLAAELRSVLSHNDRVPALEQLEREEFVIDLDGKEHMLADAAARAEEVRRRIRMENVGQELVASRIRGECYDSMEVKGTSLLAITQPGLRVRNFPIVTRDPTEVARDERTLMRRRIELREQHVANVEARDGSNPEGLSSAPHPYRNAWPGTLAPVAPDISWVVNDGAMAPVYELTVEDASAGGKGGKGGKGEGGEGKGGEAAGGEGEGKGGGDDGGDKGSGGEDDGGGEHGGASEEAMDESTLGLMYRPLTVRTSVQRRTQIVVLQAYVRELKQTFNKHFEGLYRHKEAQIDQITEKNRLITEILEELKVNEEAQNPTWQSEERPEMVVEVADDEIGVEKYVSGAELERLAKLEEERLVREAENAKDNMGQRALDSMMGGTLEAPTEANLLAQDLVRDPWMDDIAFDDMDDEQKKEFTEFEEAEKKLEDDRAKYRKGRELELRKHSSDVGEISKALDEKIREQVRLRDVYQRAVLAQELYINRLEHADVAQNHLRRQIQKAKQRLTSLHDNQDTCDQTRDEAAEQVRVYTEQVDEMARQGAAMDRGFRNAMQEVAQGAVDPDTLRALQTLYKRKPGRANDDEGGPGGQRMSISQSRRITSTRRSSFNRRASGANNSNTRSGTFNKDAGSSGSGNDTSVSGTMARAIRDAKEAVAKPVNDPMFELEMLHVDPAKKEEKERRDMLQPLDRNTDFPEGLRIDPDDPVIEALQAYRLQKIDIDLKHRTMLNKLEEMETWLEVLETKANAVADSVADLAGELASLDEQYARAAATAIVLVDLKQGQDEQEQEAVVTNYADALLVSRSVVEETNAEIRKRGAQKVATLTRIKEFNKEINLMHWEKGYNSMKLKNLEEQTGDLQMLRLDGKLQQFIKGNANVDMQKKDLDRAEAKLEHMKRAHAERMRKQTVAQRKEERKIRGKQAENDKLQSLAEELRSNVAIRMSIHRARGASENKGGDDGGGGGGGDDGGGGGGAGSAQNNAKMKSLVTRRKLVDLARAQTDEIEFLRSELDRLRQRTFPSFAHTVDNMQNPDEIY